MATSLPNTEQYPLYAASKVIGVVCGRENIEFSKCKQEFEQPKDCVDQGVKVTSCVLKVLRTMEEKCPEEFTAFQKCLKSNHRRFHECRDQQYALHASWEAIHSPNTTTPDED